MLRQCPLSISDDFRFLFLSFSELFFSFCSYSLSASSSAPCCCPMRCITVSSSISSSLSDRLSICGPSCPFWWCSISISISILWTHFEIGHENVETLATSGSSSMHLIDINGNHFVKGSNEYNQFGFTEAKLRSTEWLEPLTLNESMTIYSYSLRVIIDAATMAMRVRSPLAQENMINI